MATLTELHDLYGNGDLIKKVSAALVIAAHDLVTAPTPSTADKAYAAKVLEGPTKEAHRVIKFVLAANAGLTVATITSASDAAIQNNVNAVVPILVDVEAGV